MTLRSHVDQQLLEVAGVPLQQQTALIRRGLFPFPDSAGRWQLDVLFQHYYANKREGDDDVFRDLDWSKLDEPPKPESPTDREARIAGLRRAFELAQATATKHPNVQNVDAYARAKHELRTIENAP